MKFNMYDVVLYAVQLFPHNDTIANIDGVAIPIM